MINRFPSIKSKSLLKAKKIDSQIDGGKMDISDTWNSSAAFSGIKHERYIRLLVYINGSLNF
jgi:hypothetical protein